MEHWRRPKPTAGRRPLFHTLTVPAASTRRPFTELAAIPGLVRAKGFVQVAPGEWRLLQVVGARVTSTPWTIYPSAAEIVVIRVPSGE